METFWDFSKGREFNPIKNITQFFINPYQPCNSRILNLEKRVEEYGKHVGEMSFYNGIPINKFSIGVLKLNKCLVKWKEVNSGAIESGNIKIYFKVIDDTTIRIDTVICH